MSPRCETAFLLRHRREAAFRQRAVLGLRYYADLSEVEIAQILKCRLGTVKSAHHRAIANLRKELT